MTPGDVFHVPVTDEEDQGHDEEGKVAAVWEGRFTSVVARKWKRDDWLVELKASLAMDLHMRVLLINRVSRY